MGWQRTVRQRFFPFTLSGFDLWSELCHSGKSDRNPATLGFGGNRQVSVENVGKIVNRWEKGWNCGKMSLTNRGKFWYFCTIGIRVTVWKRAHCYQRPKSLEFRILKSVRQKRKFREKYLKQFQKSPNFGKWQENMLGTTFVLKVFADGLRIGWTHALGSVYTLTKENRDFPRGLGNPIFDRGQN